MKIMFDIQLFFTSMRKTVPNMIQYDTILIEKPPSKIDYENSHTHSKRQVSNKPQFENELINGKGSRSGCLDLHEFFLSLVSIHINHTFKNMRFFKFTKN